MMMKERYTILISLLFAFLGVSAQATMPGLRQGKLANGMTYYVKHSSLEPGKVSIYLVQNVGAILEEDNENGLAHFLEHMAFNGTRHFPRGVMSWLRGKGIYTFNAHTGVNETVYSIDAVPLERQGIVDTCFLIVKDWCDELLLKDEDIDAERGVIVEEWRVRNTPDSKIQNAVAPELYNHSKFARRNVIGNVELLKTFHPDVLRAFYHKWYRPDLQCVIVVGDIDPVEYEKKVEQLFGTIPVVENAPERYDITIDDNVEPLYKLVLESENTVRTISIAQRVKRPDYPNDEVRRKYRESARLFNTLWARRITRLKNANGEQFLAANVDFGRFVKGYNTMSMDIMPFNGKDADAFRQVWGMWEEIRRFGFTKEEIERVLEEQLSELQELERNLDQNRNNYYIDLFKSNFLLGTPCPDMEEEIEKSRETIFEFTPEDMQEWLRSWADDNRNITILISGNDPGYAYLTREEVVRMMNEIRRENRQQQEVKKDVPVFFDLKLTPATVVKTRPLKRFNAEIWTLSNGAKVVYKNVPEGNGTFSMACSSHGGASVVATGDLPSLTAMQALTLKSGLYKHDRNTLMDLMSGKRMNMTFMLDEYNQGMGGQAPVEHAEMFFQYLYLMFEKPRFDREQFDKYIERQRYLYRNTVKTALDRVRDSIQNLLVLKDARNRDFDLSYIDEMDFDKLEKLYHDRFANARQFTFCIVGDIDREEAKRLACIYIGNLPSRKGKKEKFVLRDYSVKHDSLIKEYNAEMPDDRGIVEISFLNDKKMSNKEQLAFMIYGMMLKNHFFELIREQEGGAYDVDVTAGYSAFPFRRESLDVKFLTKRERTDDLKQIVYRQIELMKERLFSPAEIEQIVVMLKQNKEEADSCMDPQYWMNVLNYYVVYGVDITSPDNFENIIDTITPGFVRKTVLKFFKKARKQEFIIKSTPVEQKPEWEHF
ncbi:insulinase family protein [uncultured Sanguibacteroides sp.]|uniref:M16 family metallopeptidase n=2 Tax=uncultured Sanguibacteroides sp. TaxID=1635151 RepID=UPI0025FE8607|nr:insulinase family protein [uncultured Sanguibacteroides sp.]